VSNPPPSWILAAAGLQLALAAVLVAYWCGARRDWKRARDGAGFDARARMLAHELNQPLTAILSNAQAAQRFMAAAEPDLRELREILDDIVLDDKRAAGIIRQLAGLLKEETGDSNEGARATAPARKEGAA
jgi:signal transduction histidine kinase